MTRTRLPSVDEPFGFKHELDRDLFALDRLDALFGRAPAGKAAAQLGDPGRERPRGTGPVMTQLEAPLGEDVLRRPLHVHFHDLLDWAPEYRPAYEHLLEAAGLDRSAPRYHESPVIRVFSPDVPVALHGDGEKQVNCGLNGRNVWHVYRPTALTETENEGLLRGGQFVPWREMELFESFDLHPGDGFYAPSRWPHWIEHPGPDPAVSFELGWYGVDDVRARKVWDVNWMLRKAGLKPSPPGRDERRDHVKRRVFDAISVATRKGGEFRGI